MISEYYLYVYKALFISRFIILQINIGFQWTLFYNQSQFGLSLNEWLLKNSVSLIFSMTVTKELKVSLDPV